MKIKYILGLFLVLFSNIKSQNSQNLKTAIDNLNLNKVKSIINNEPSLLNTSINDKSLLNYVLETLKTNFFILEFSETLDLESNKAYKNLKDGWEILKFLTEQGAPESVDYQFSLGNLVDLVRGIEPPSAIMLELVDYVVNGPLQSAIDIVKGNEFQEIKNSLTEANSSWSIIIEFLNKIKTQGITHDKDILESILFGQICPERKNIPELDLSKAKVCKDKVKESVEWKAYKLAKAQGLFALGKFIRNFSELLLGLPNAQSSIQQKSYLQQLWNSLVSLFSENKEVSPEILAVLPQDLKAEILKFIVIE